MTYDDEPLKADEVAKWLRVGRKSIYNAVRENRIPYRRLGRRILFSRQAIMAWLQSQGRVAQKDA